MNYAKWLGRLNDSKWTRFFMIIAVLQTIVVIGLESSILFENNQETSPLTVAETSTDNSTYVAGVTAAHDRFYRIKWEDIAFIAFQLWVLWLSFDGIIHQNTVEIIALAVINGLCALAGVVQTADSAKWIPIIAGYGVEVNDLSIAEKIEIALAIVVGLFASLMGYMSWKLYQEFGWNIYKKIGADLEIQSMYKTFQYYVLILKINIFFQFLSSIFFLIQLAMKPLTEILPWQTIYLGVVTALILPSLALGRASVSTESKIFMSTFILFEFVVLTHFALILSKIMLPKNNWYFWIFVVWCGILSTISAIVIGFLCMRKFGKGLKPYVQRGARKSLIAGFDVENSALATANPGVKGWEIDDVQNGEEMAQFDITSPSQDTERQLDSVDLSERYSQQNTRVSHSQYSEKVEVE